MANAEFRKVEIWAKILGQKHQHTVLQLAYTRIRKVTTRFLFVPGMFWNIMSVIKCIKSVWRKLMTIAFPPGCILLPSQAPCCLPLCLWTPGCLCRLQPGAWVVGLKFPGNVMSCLTQWSQFSYKWVSREYRLGMERSCGWPIITCPNIRKTMLEGQGAWCSEMSPDFEVR